MSCYAWFYNYGVILTYLSLASSVLGILAVLNGPHIVTAIVCLMVSGFLDAFDGTVARTRKNATAQEKSFGIQIDSLCDMVCFGVLPACIGGACGLHRLWQLAILVLFVLAALIRLAYYNVMEMEQRNVDEEGKRFFQGLPVTSVAIILPIVYGIIMYCGLFRWADVILPLMFALIGIGYVVKVKIRKPSIYETLALILFGALVMAAILFFRFSILKR